MERRTLVLEEVGRFLGAKAVVVVETNKENRARLLQNFILIG